jgi:LAO/AO transport system kinase
MDAWGLDPILIETVGVGQDEVDIAKLADVSVVVLVPGAGDGIQALKAGVMEIADIFVVNKSDQNGADRLEHAILSALELDPGEGKPRVLRTVATTGEGVAGLAARIESCHEQLRNDPSRQQRRRDAVGERLARLLGEELAGSAIRKYGDDALEHAVTDILARQRDPHSVAREIMENPVAGPRLEHIGIAANALDDATAGWEALGMEVVGIEDVPEDGVRVALLPLGEGRIELLEATRPDSPVEKFIRKRGPGLHHIAIRVENIDRSLDRLRAAGIRLVDDVPRRGAEGTRIAFLHPASLNGVLVELVEHE